MISYMYIYIYFLFFLRYFVLNLNCKIHENIFPEFITLGEWMDRLEYSAQ